MDRYSGCGCCCVSLVVDNDNSDKWQHSDVSGVETVTILQAIDLHRFQLKLSINKPARNVDNHYSAAWSGNLTIYVLDDPADGNVDAIGSITFELHNATSTAGVPYSNVDSLPFYYGGSGTALGPPEQGSGDIDFDTDMSIIESYACDGVSHTYGSGDSGRLDLVLASFDNVLMWGKQRNTVIGGYFYHGTTTSPATTKSFTGQVIANRDECTEKKVYLRYVVEDDFNLDTDGIVFTLQTLNEVGDNTCRTDSSYYEPDPESGNCISPPAICDVLRKRQPPFGKINFALTDSTAFSGTEFGFSWFWGDGDGVDGSQCGSNTWVIVNDIGGGFNTITFSATVTLTCDAGTIVLEVAFSYMRGFGDGPYESTWEIELPIATDHPSQISETLNEANSLTFDYPGESAELTINA